jgi:hypothetical protein
VLQHRPGQLLDPLAGGAADPAAVAVAGGGQRPVGDAAGEIEDRTDLARVAPGGRRRLVDDGPRGAVALAEPVGRVAGDPAVGHPPGGGQRLRADRPGPYGRRGHRSGLDLAHLVVLALVGDRRAAARQELDQDDRLLEGVHGGGR